MKDQNKLQERQAENKKKLMDAAKQIIERDGIDKITVRNVCKEAGVATGLFYYYFQNKDELLLAFIMDNSFDECKLSIPLSDIAERITELFYVLVDQYLSFGKNFLCSFFTPTNKTLAEYMNSTEAQFIPGSLLARCEQELIDAQSEGYLPETVDAHALTGELCILSKGIFFEYCLSDDSFDIYGQFRKMVCVYIDGSK